MSHTPLELPPELAGVPFNALKDFLSHYSRVLVSQVAPEVPDQCVLVAVDQLLGSAGTAPAPVDIRLEFRHICKNTGCLLDDCQLCRNNPNKVCDDSDCFDHQYWVRDDGKGGQLIKAKCGADVAVQIIDKATNSPLYMPEAKVKLYVVNGQQLASSSPSDAAPGLYLSDDGNPLFTAAGTAPEDDRGVPLELVQDDRLGPVAQIPDFQFLNKNSKFKCGGRTFKSFKLQARASRIDPGTGCEVVLAQVETESFKVTTKKGYDGCRKAEYLYAHDPITDKTFANLGETTISNLKARFDGVETVADLMYLVQACRSQPDMEQQLRETLNMARDVDKWRNLTRMLSKKVVWEDNIPRIFVIPNITRPLGLLYRTTNGQVEFGNPIGVLLRPPAASGQLHVSRLSEKLQVTAGRQIEVIRTLAAGFWNIARHQGWAPAPETLLWDEAAAADVIDAFTDCFGVGDPLMAADLHLAAYSQLAAAAAVTPFLQHSPGPSGTPPLNNNSNTGGLGVISHHSQGGIGYGVVPGVWDPAAAAAGGVRQPDDLAAAAAAAVSGTTGPRGMSHSGVTFPSSGLEPGVSGSGGYDLAAVDSKDLTAAAAAAAAAAAGYVQRQQQYSLPAHMLPQRSAPISSGSKQQGGLPSSSSAPAAAAAAGGLALPTLLNPNQVVLAGHGSAVQQQQQQQMALMSGRSSGPRSSDTAAAAAAVTGLSAGFATGLVMAHEQPQQMHAANYSSGLGSGNLASPGYTAAAAAAGCVQGIGNHPTYSNNPQQQQQQYVQQQQQQQQFVGVQRVAADLSSPMMGMSAGYDARTNSSTPSAMSIGLDAAQQQQYQSQAPSQSTLLLQRAIVENWPAAQVKAVLEGMSDDELRVLVAQQPTTAAGVLAKASGAPAQGLAAAANGVVLEPQQQQQQQQPMHGQMQPAGALAGELAAAAAAAVQNPNRGAEAGSPQQQQQQQQQQGAAGSAAAAAAALAALFADAGDGTVAAAAAAGDRAGSFDIQLTTDQQNPLNLSFDSFGDPSQWGDLLENLRALSSSSSGPKCDAAAGNSIMSTDWIPEFLFRLESESAKGRGDTGLAAAAAAAVAAAEVGSAVSPPAAAAAAAAVDEGLPSRKGKRERSVTGQAPTAEQLAQLQALMSEAPDKLRSLSKGQLHFGSFNRHFPTARVSSQLASVAEGSQVANPWQPGMLMSATGIPADMQQQQQQQQSSAAAAAVGRPAVTTPSPPVSQTNPRAVITGSSTAVAAAAAVTCAGLTKEGAAAVATVTGFDQPLPAVEDVGAPLSLDTPSTDLLHVLGLLDDESLAAGVDHTAAGLDLGPAAAAGGSSAAAGGSDMLSNHSTGLTTPFEGGEPQPAAAAAADAAAALVHAPTLQRDTSGKAGWISGLLRSGSSRSSKGSGSGQLVSVGSGQDGKDIVISAAAAAAAVMGSKNGKSRG